MNPRVLMFARLILVGLAPTLASAWTSDTAVNTTVSSAGAELKEVAATADGSGGVFLAWADERGADLDIYAQHLDATGTAQWAANGIAVHVNPGTDDRAPELVADGAGGVILLWYGGGLVAQRLDANGDLLWGASPVVVTGAGAAPVGPNYLGLNNYRLVGDGAGGAIVVWEDARNGTGDHDVYAQRLDTDGNRQWGADDVAVTASAGYEAYPAVAGDGAGGVLIAWYYSLDPESNVRVQRLNSAGAVQWTAGGVAMTSGANPVEATTIRIVGDGTGGGVLSWMETLLDQDNMPLGDRLSAQRLDPLGAPQWGTGGVQVASRSSVDPNERPASFREQNLIVDGADGAIVAWLDWYGPLPWDGPGGEEGVHVQRLAAVDGSFQWQAGGVWVGPGSSEGLDRVPLVGDSSSGVIVAAWVRDHTSLADGFYAHLVDAAGGHPWGTAGVVVTTRSALMESPLVVTDEAGGAILAWRELANDSGAADLLAQNVAGDGGTSGLETPVNQSPADGATSDNTPDLAASAFVDNQGTLSHAASQWRLHDAPALTPEVPVAERNTDDDFVEGIPLPFRFPFFGRTITAVAAGTNGMVELLEDGERSTYVGGPGNHQLDRYVDQVDAIFACNDNLDTTDGYLRVYDGGSHVTIEWYATTVFDGSIIDHPLLFQVVLYPSGEIRWNFQELAFTLYEYDLFSGVYPVGGTEVAVGSAIDVQSSYRFDPGTSSVTALAYDWQGAGPVLYDSGETTVDLTAHTVPAAAGLADAGTYYWGVRFRADNGEWTPWSAATSLLVSVPAIVVTDPVGAADDRAVPFGSVEMGLSGSYTVTVGNTGTGDLVLSTLGGNDTLSSPFSLTPGTCLDATVASSGSCEFTVSFAPTAAGTFSDSFDIPSNDPAEPVVTVTLTGSGTAVAAVPDIAVTNSSGSGDDLNMEFGGVRAGDSGVLTVTVTNLGAGSLSLDPIAAPAAPYTIEHDTCQDAILPQDDACTFNVKFSPTAVGTFPASLAIASNDPDEGTVTVNLNGTGEAAPDIAVTNSSSSGDPLVVDFGSVVKDNPPGTEDIIVQNDGGADLVLTQVVLGGAPSLFSISANTCGSPVPPAGSCSITVQFAPTAADPAGPASDTVTIRANDPVESPVTVNLTGTVTDPAVAVAPWVASVTPANGTGQVGVWVGMVTATFSKAMDPTTLTTGSFTLSGPSGLVAGTVSYDAAAFTAVFRPDGPLEYDAQYFASVSNTPAAVQDADGTALGADYLWTFITRSDPAAGPNEGECNPELGVEDGCANFDGFTYGTGAYSPGCGPTNCTGILGIDSARRQLSHGRASYDAPALNTETVAVDAGARVDATRFLLTARSQDRSPDDEHTSGDAYAASRIDVAGAAPGILVPMTLVIDPSASGIGAAGWAAVGVQVRDFGYRTLASAYAREGTGNVDQLTLYHSSNPADPGALQRTDTPVGGLPAQIRLEFLFPADPGNGVFVELRGAATRGGDNAGDVSLNVSAQLDVDPRPGITVSLASGQTFTGAADSDGDGVADAADTSPDDASLATPAAATGTGVIEVDVGATPGATLGELRTVSASDPLLNQTGRPAGQNFPDGLVSFRINGLELGAEVDVTLDFPTSVPAGATYYKVDEAGFHPLDPQDYDIVGSRVTLHLQDGGAGDGDGVANGVIVDPGGVAIPEAAAPGGGGGGGGGGCFLRTLGGGVDG